MVTVVSYGYLTELVEPYVDKPAHDNTKSNSIFYWILEYA